MASDFGEWHRVAVTMPAPRNPTFGMCVKILAPLGSFRLEREYRPPASAETNPYLTASSSDGRREARRIFDGFPAGTGSLRPAGEPTNPTGYAPSNDDFEYCQQFVI